MNKFLTSSWIKTWFLMVNVNFDVWNSIDDDDVMTVECLEACF